MGGCGLPICDMKDIGCERIATECLGVSTGAPFGGLHGGLGVSMGCLRVSTGVLVDGMDGVDDVGGGYLRCYVCHGADDVGVGARISSERRKRSLFNYIKMMYYYQILLEQGWLPGKYIALATRYKIL